MSSPTKVPMMVSALLLGIGLLASLMALRTPIAEARGLENTGAPPAPAAARNVDAGHTPPFEGNFLVSVEGDNPTHPAIAHNTTPGSDTYLLVYTSMDSRHVYAQLHTTLGVPQGERFLVSTITTTQSAPDVTYDAASNEYIVVWEDWRPDGDQEIRGRHISAAGSPRDPEFVVTGLPGDHHDPAIACNPGANVCLVVWMDERNVATQGGNIYGRGIDHFGMTIGLSLQISSSPGDELFPDVVYNSGDQDYLVVWQHQVSDSESTIAGRIVGADGTFHGDEHDISLHTSTFQTRPRVAVDGIHNMYVVVWQEAQDIGSRDADIYGTIMGNDWLTMREIVVADAVGEQMYPDIVYNPEAREFLVIWGDLRSPHASDWGVYGQRVRTNTSPAVLPQGNFVVAEGTLNQSYPAAIYSSTSHQYVVVWQDIRQGAVTPGTPLWSIYAQRVWWQGLPVGDTIALDAAVGSQERPAVAYNALNHEYLIVWEDERKGNTDIYGRLHNDEGLQLSGLLIIGDGAGDQKRPSVAFNPNHNAYLVVWEDQGRIKGRMLGFRGAPLGPTFTVSYNYPYKSAPVVACNHFAAYDDFLVVFESSEGGSPDIFGHRVTADGIPTGSDFPISQLPGIQSDPDVVFNPEAEEFLVVWQDDHYADFNGDFDILARRVGPTHILLDATIWIANHSGSVEDSPAVTHNPLDNQYLVVWRQSRPGESGVLIKARLLQEFGAWIGDTFSVAPSTATQHNPDADFAVSPGRFRVVWEDGRAPTTNPDIYGQWIARDGTPLSPSGTPIFRYTGWQNHPTIVYGVHGNSGAPQMLTVWHDGRSGVDTDIYAQTSPIDATPPTARFTRDPTSGRVGSAFIFNAWPSYDDITPRRLLQVKWDLDNDGVYDTPLGYEKVVTHTFTETGIHIITLMVEDRSQFTSTLSLPVRVFPAPPSINLSPHPAMATASPTTSLTLTPTTIVAGERVLVETPSTAGGSAVAVRWDWENDGIFDTSFGTVFTATHVYTAAGLHTARVEVSDTTGLTGAALHNVTVLPGTPLTLAVAPITATLAPGSAVQTAATAWDIYGNRMLHPIVTWTLNDPDAGSLDATGVFTASTKAGSYHDAIIVTSGTATGSAFVTVFWPNQVYLPLGLRH